MAKELTQIDIEKIVNQFVSEINPEVLKNRILRYIYADESIMRATDGYKAIIVNGEFDPEKVINRIPSDLPEVLKYPSFDMLLKGFTNPVYVHHLNLKIVVKELKEIKRRFKEHFKSVRLSFDNTHMRLKLISSDIISLNTIEFAYKYDDFRRWELFEFAPNELSNILPSLKDHSFDLDNLILAFDSALKLSKGDGITIYTREDLYGVTTNNPILISDFQEKHFKITIMPIRK